MSVPNGEVDLPDGSNRWTRRHVVGLSITFAAAVAIRALLLPTPGLRDDLDQFVGWVHHIATQGLATLYGPTAAGPVTFGPVMAYIWAALAAVQPAFATATDAADPAIRVAMKLPAAAADLTVAMLVAFALRSRPTWAVIGAASILLHPALIDVSAWWGQYDSVYIAPSLGAAILALNGRIGWAAALLAVAVLTKPQALPLLVPFAAWAWTVGGPRAVLRAVLVGAATSVILWLPFAASGGPAGYLANLAYYQNDVFNILSVRAWNVWWLVQELAAGGAFIGDDIAIVGPLTLRHLGYGLVGVLELLVALAIIRDPRPRTFILGLIASVLVTVAFATQMHERYAYGAVVFAALLLMEARARWLAVALGVVFTLNLLAAIPPTPEIERLLPVAGPLGIIGSVAMLLITYAALRMLGEGRRDRVAAPAPPGS